jgi:hypothetical protein
MMFYEHKSNEKIKLQKKKKIYVGAGSRGGVTNRRVRIGITVGSAFFLASRHSSSKDFSKGRFRFKSLFFDVASSSPNAVINSILSFTGVLSTGDGDRDFDFAFITGNFGISRLR